MTNEKTIQNLIAIKTSIIKQATDVMWMDGSISETICERIDSMLSELGVSDDEIEKQYFPDEITEDPMGAGPEPIKWP